MRVWTDGDERSRVALLGDTSEYSVVQDGAEAWTYSSTDDAVVHYSPRRRRRRAGTTTWRRRRRPATCPSRVTCRRPPRPAARRSAMARLFSTVSLDAQTDGRRARRLPARRDAEERDHPDREDRGGRGRRDLAPRCACRCGAGRTPRPPRSSSGSPTSRSRRPPTPCSRSRPRRGASTKDVVVPLPEEPTEAPTRARRAARGRDRLRHRLGHRRAGVRRSTSRACSPATRRAAEALPGADRTFDSKGAAGPLRPVRARGGQRVAAGLRSTPPRCTTSSRPRSPRGGCCPRRCCRVLVTDDGRVLVGAVPGETLQALAR